MNTDPQAFAARFTTSLGNAPGLTMPLLRPLLTLLATREPVTISQLAEHAGRSEEDIRHTLACMPDTEYDTQGRIIGFGLTFNPTPHRYETGGRTFYTWCALDTLAFPAVLNHTAQVTSPCRATGEPVRVTVTPDGPSQVHPATAVVSLVAPETPSSVRTSFCNQVHFFASADSAKDWLHEHPEARVLTVTEAFEIGRPIIEQIQAGDPTPHGCC
ncbi:alkylmercury lyase [Streptomyces sp. CNQ-509]|uniref:organomercurial lyase MerB n=1 Tax=Streptomyces sp. CNQ-509 TaxID=444103 RepID=UPI00062DF818|nr:organomercurial lyase MerB [Streptomyces sp. CNQ-509]AKH83950.1 alkylmercury lyase [Streptomyces sp. CNQ-509]